MRVPPVPPASDFVRTKDVLETAGVPPPGWLAGPAVPAASAVFDVPASSLHGAVLVRTWAPAGTPDDQLLPLLVVHDGPEYDGSASLTRYLAAGLAQGWLPPLRAALLSPGQRHSWYSASAPYARAVRLAVLPALERRLATSLRIGMGASLGALAMLHAQCSYPDAFHALFLQSGSFFSPRYDEQERRFAHYPRITDFVAGVQAGRPSPAMSVVMTCGAQEENIHNNRLMALALNAAGGPAALVETPGAHNWTAWRAALDPHLTGLLRQVGQGPRGPDGRTQ